MTIKAEDYKLNDEQMAFGLSPEVLANQHTAELPQDRIGYSDEMMLGLYQIATELSEAKRHDEAVAAFTFLSTLNPNVAAFWTGLGITQCLQQDLGAGLKSYQKAVEADPTNFDGYLYLCKYHLDLNDQDAALAVIDEGRQRAEHADNPEDWEDFLEKATAAEAVIKEGGF